MGESTASAMDKTVWCESLGGGFMLTGRDTKTGVEVVDNGEDGGIRVKGSEVGSDEAQQRNNDNEYGVEPVDMLVPVGHGHGRVRNVHLARVLLPGPQGLVVGRPVRERRGGGGSRRHVGVEQRVELEDDVVELGSASEHGGRVRWCL